MSNDPNNIKNSSNQNAINKLKAFSGNKKTTYSERKKISIEETKKLLIKNNIDEVWLKLINGHKKKDDLADCFLQAKWYISNKLNN